MRREIVELTLLPAIPSSLLIEEAMRLLKHFTPTSIEHALQTTKLGIALFDGLCEFLAVEKSLEEEIICASLLHDIGTSIAEEDHNKISRNLILEHFTLAEMPLRKRIALIARYHRKSLPKPTHKDFQELSPVDKRVVLCGLSTLRIADGLDRSHRSAVMWLQVKSFADRLQINIQTDHSAEAEINAALKKSDGMQKFLDKKVLILSD
ncbi:MAG: HD domain-containing protein [Candidatus Riflebacteria bacterium]|nr:HD domain-containing protein [Candidatus Riflebacteria bacterium]